jgi:hypothetical protein
VRDTNVGGVLMENNELREYRTGQGVPISGSYICQSGKRAKLSKDETFPKCPDSGNETFWKHDTVSS